MSFNFYGYCYVGIVNSVRSTTLGEMTPPPFFPLNYLIIMRILFVIQFMWLLQKTRLKSQRQLRVWDPDYFEED